ncbi:hypothetical protein A2480_02145 [Candidatus Uhrbacteria bacterium RIFOXYC2_FULL_47_19]|uniref:Uncharacterized protein n=1 Tax=Candidatus Uhrbacteria bacterium RIFOXYC2_FULL_47_19 TaxID=1802424 RepID=A0A1F7WG30_9BACT|nr:MAG: hypothetical protein A2480_02145 [Candidatus Uhrbacteria bacterium RIFOXYC2_FULL_47_19]HCC21864.1 hypothetical protein [Candidatus Uhrbacteria bacterium]
MEGLNSDEKRNYGETGRTFEFLMLGEIDTKDPKYKRLLSKLSDGSSKPNYLDRNRAISLVKESQPGDPENPSRPFFKDLLIEVQDGLENNNIQAKVKAFTAVGTPLDYLHGIDAFLTVTLQGKEYICTIDVTLNQDKQNFGHKADLIIGELSDPTNGKTSEEKYLKEIEKIGKLATANLLEQINKKSGQENAELRKRLFGSDQPEAGVDL